MDKQATQSVRTCDDVMLTVNTTCQNIARNVPDHFVGRRRDKLRILDLFFLHCSSWIHIHGDAGVGKMTADAATVQYVHKRFTCFMVDRIDCIHERSDVNQLKETGMVYFMYSSRYI
jgi:hypothetical protein